MDGAFKTTIMKCFMVLFIATLTVASPTTNGETENGNTQSAPRLQAEDSVSQLQALVDKDSPEVRLLTDDEIKDYFENSDKSVPRVSDLVARVKQREKRLRLLWRGTLGAAAVTGPFRTERIVHDRTSAQTDRDQASGVSDPFAGEGRDSTHSGAEAPALATQGQRPERSEDETTSSGDRSGPRTGGTSHGGKITISIDAVKNPRRSRRRRMRTGLFRPLNDQRDNVVFYPSRWTTSSRSNYARGRSRHASPAAEALALLTQKLSKLDVDIARLKEAVLLQGAVHIKTSQRMEAMLLAQGKMAVKNDLDMRKVLKRLRRCCGCLSGGGTRASNKAREVRTSDVSSRPGRRRSDSVRHNDRRGSDSGRSNDRRESESHQHHTDPSAVYTNQHHNRRGTSSSSTGRNGRDKSVDFNQQDNSRGRGSHHRHTERRGSADSSPDDSRGTSDLHQRRTNRRGSADSNQNNRRGSGSHRDHTDEEDAVESNQYPDSGIKESTTHQPTGREGGAVDSDQRGSRGKASQRATISTAVNQTGRSSGQHIGHRDEGQHATVSTAVDQTRSSGRHIGEGEEGQHERTSTSRASTTAPTTPPPGATSPPTKTSAIGTASTNPLTTTTTTLLESRIAATTSVTATVSTPATATTFQQQITTDNISPYADIRTLNSGHHVTQSSNADTGNDLSSAANKNREAGGENDISDSRDNFSLSSVNIDKLGLNDNKIVDRTVHNIENDHADKTFDNNNENAHLLNQNREAEEQNKNIIISIEDKDSEQMITPSTPSNKFGLDKTTLNDENRLATSSLANTKSEELDTTTVLWLQTMNTTTEDGAVHTNVIQAEQEAVHTNVIKTEDEQQTTFESVDRTLVSSRKMESGQGVSIIGSENGRQSDQSINDGSVEERKSLASTKASTTRTHVTDRQESAASLDPVPTMTEQHAPLEPKTVATMSAVSKTDNSEDDADVYEHTGNVIKKGASTLPLLDSASKSVDSVSGRILTTAAPSFMSSDSDTDADENSRSSNINSINIGSRNKDFFFTDNPNTNKIRGDDDDNNNLNDVAGYDNNIDSNSDDLGTTSTVIIHGNPAYPASGAPSQLRNSQSSDRLSLSSDIATVRESTATATETKQPPYGGSATLAERGFVTDTQTAKPSTGVTAASTEAEYVTDTHAAKASTSVTATTAERRYATDTHTAKASTSVTATTAEGRYATDTHTAKSTSVTATTAEGRYATDTHTAKASTSVTATTAERRYATDTHTAKLSTGESAASAVRAPAARTTMQTAALSPSAVSETSAKEGHIRNLTPDSSTVPEKLRGTTSSPTSATTVFSAAVAATSTAKGTTEIRTTAALSTTTMTLPTTTPTTTESSTTTTTSTSTTTLTVPSENTTTTEEGIRVRVWRYFVLV